ncbi:MAG: LEPR-XLL domain-containing protein [Verrucomicrobia bacterium]|nr:LEPR-XLL domain-containing protein [Verrucomicrobiota bacterium]
MAAQSRGQLFDLEALEPRLLLSAVPTGVEVASAAPDAAGAELVYESGPQEPELIEPVGTAAQTSSLFEGLPREELDSTSSQETNRGDLADEVSGIDAQADLEPTAGARGSSAGLASVQGEPAAVDLVGPLQLVPPVGAGIYSLPSSPNGGRDLGSSWLGSVEGHLDRTGDSRVFRIALDLGRIMSVRLGLWDEAAQARLDLRGVGGQLLGTVMAQGSTPCDIQGAVTEAGSYSIMVTSLQGASDFSVYLLLSGQFESEPGGANTNDSIMTAQFLGPVTTTGPPAVVGNVYPDSPDWYSLDLTAGQNLTLTAAVLRFAAARHVDLQVTDVSGAVLARGVPGGSLGLDEYLCSFQAPASGRYYIKVSGEVYATYTLAVAVGRQVGLDLLATGTESAQRLQNGEPVMGYLDDPEYSLEPDAYAHGTILTDAVNGLHLSVVGSSDPVTAALSDRRSTGSSAFGHGVGGDNAKWSSNRLLFRADFAQPVASVSIDATAVNAFPSAWAFLQAYNSSGEQIAIVQTPTGASMNYDYTLAVRRLVPDIAYFVAGGLGGYDAALDNLVVGLDHADVYQAEFQVGAAVEIHTATPGDGSGEPFNTLDPRLAVYDAEGTLVVSNDTGMPDIKNARVQFTAGIGLYCVRVEARGRGEYELQFVQGMPVNPPPYVVASDPAPAATIAHVPTRIVFPCSEGVRADFLNPASLTVDNFGPATAVELLDGQTVAFTINVPDVEGSYTYRLAAGALVDLQGLASAAWDGAFTVDCTGPRVVSQVPSPATNKPVPNVTLTFSEALLTSSVSTADVVSFTGPGGQDLKSRISRLDVQGAVVTVVFSTQLSNDGEYRLVLGPSIQDLVGNGMDQNQNGVNGETTDRYTGIFDLQLPDLTADSVSFSPTSAEFGRPLDITWVTRNAGRGAADGPWNVWIRLSKHAIASADDWALASLLADAPNPLPAGATDSQTVRVTLPLQSQFTDGTYYVFVELDKDKQVYELVETNNIGNNTIDITVPILPDLQVIGTVNPTTINPGGEVRVEWTVTNHGEAPGEIPWRDILYLSRNQTFEEASDVWLFTYDPTQKLPLQVSSSYIASQTVVVPDTTTVATYYVLVLTDRYNDQMESNDTNNLAALRLDVKAPDLTVTALTGPANALHGASIDVSWTVRNGGAFAATKTWSDGFYLSTNTTWSADDIPATTILTTASLPLATGSSHQQTAKIKLPLQPDLTTARYYLLAKADALGVLSESNENNNVRSFSVNLTVPPLPDLAVTDIAAPLETMSGRQIPISWTIANQRTATAAGPWVDRLYLADNSAGANPVWYGEFTFDGEVRAGQSIVRSKSIRLPYDLSGPWWVVVSVDDKNDVYEHGIDANNRQVDDVPIDVRLSPFPSLQVLTVQAPSSVHTQQEVRFEWVVANSGTGPTTVPVWQDEVWVSLDRILNPLEDCLIGRAQNPTSLAPGESYTNSLTANLGYEPYGDCYIIVVADRITTLGYDWDGNVTSFDVADRMFEPGREDDNTGVSDVFPLTLTPPPDLQVVWVEAPYDAFAGQSVTVKFRIENRGLGPTAGPGDRWKDRIYFSRDEVPADEDDVSLAGMYYQGTLEVGEGYTVTKSVQIPEDASGDYYLIALTNWNPKTHLYEDGFNGNNSAHAGHVTRIRIPPRPTWKRWALTWRPRGWPAVIS